MGKKAKKFLVPLLSAFAGALLVVVILRIRPDMAPLIAGKPPAPPQSLTPQSILKHMEDEDPFGDEGFFSFKGFPFDQNLLDAQQTGIGNITSREDENHIYYDIPLEGVDPSSVQTKVQNGYLTIQAEVKKEESPGSFFQSSFQQSFPLSSNVEPGQIRISSEKDKITLQLTKKTEE